MQDFLMEAKGKLMEKKIFVNKKSQDYERTRQQAETAKSPGRRCLLETYPPGGLCAFFLWAKVSLC